MSQTDSFSDSINEAGGYVLDILVHGYPGKSVCHGSLGWSSIVLLRGHGRIALIDVGAFGVRHLLIDKLNSLGLKPEDVTDVVLTHSHYDHSINWTLFSGAKIHIAGAELDWSLTVPWGRTPVPELYMKELSQWHTLNRIESGQEILPNLISHAAPGHTPGHLVFVLIGKDKDVIFTGDAAKNRAELLEKNADMSLSLNDSMTTFEKIWSLWEIKTRSVLIPGHDLPMVIKNGKPFYLSKREAGIRSWMGESLEQVTEFSLTV